MKTQVDFQSSKFPPYEGEEEQINPGIWGRRLTEYLAARLAERGIETGEMAIEDWGCYLPIRNERFRLALCCGHQRGDDEEFMVFTDPGTPKIRKLFRTIDGTAEMTRLLGALRHVLESDPDIHAIVWSEQYGTLAQ